MLDALILILCGLALYHHVVFPIVLKRIKPQEMTSTTDREEQPRITLIVPAYNEALTVADKIINTARLDYPRDKLDLLIACDGCTDKTVEVARLTQDLPEVKGLKMSVIDFHTNRGKVAVLNDMIARAESDIIALSDCSASLSSDALKRLAGHFNDPKVGVVGGTYQLDQCQDAAEQVYWAYQRAIKKGEAALGAPMGMHGAFYAFRKSLSAPLPANTINDDFILPMKIVAKGYRALYDTRIICQETEATTDQMNWKRRLRISAGNVQQALYCLDLLNPKYPGIAFAFFSGKFLRAWMPFILCAIFLLSGYGALDQTAYQVFFSLQLLGLALICLPLPPKGILAKIILTLRYIIIGHLAGFLGGLKYLSGLEKGVWKRAN